MTIENKGFNTGTAMINAVRGVEKNGGKIHEIFICRPSFITDDGYIPAESVILIGLDKIKALRDACNFALEKTEN